MHFNIGTAKRERKLCIRMGLTNGPHYFETGCLFKKYLGYIKDQQLVMKSHMTYTMSKLNKVLRIFRWVRPVLTTRSAILLFKALKA